MIIRVTPKQPILSEINFPKYEGQLEPGCEYKYETLSKGSNKFMFQVSIRYVLTNAGNEFEVIKSISEFEVEKMDTVLLIEIYQIVRQATHNIASHLFNNSGFMPIEFSVISEYTLEDLRPDLELALLKVNR